MDLTELEWRKSSKSAVNNCVEFADTPDGGMALRDSKQNGRPDQVILVFDRAEREAFIGGVKDGELD